MKNKKNKTNKNRDRWMEVITPLKGELPPGGFYDDCPLCQDLKRMFEMGEVEKGGMADKMAFTYNKAPF